MEQVHHNKEKESKPLSAHGLMKSDWTSGRGEINREPEDLESDVSKAPNGALLQDGSEALWRK